MQNFPTILSRGGWVKVAVVYPRHQWVNSLWRGDSMWRHGTRSTLAQVMACCLTAPSHYLNQCWLIIREVAWHSFECITIRRSEGTNQWNKIETCNFKMVSRFNPNTNELKCGWNHSNPLLKSTPEIIDNIMIIANCHFDTEITFLTLHNAIARSVMWCLWQVCRWLLSLSLPHAFNIIGVKLLQKEVQKVHLTNIHKWIWYISIILMMSKAHTLALKKELTILKGYD